MLETLTKEQEQLMDVVAEERIALLTSKKTPTESDLREGIDMVYRITGYEPPKIYICDSPKACVQKANDLNNTKDQDYSFAYRACVGDYGWLSFYDYFHRIGIDYEEVEQDFLTFKNLVQQGIYDIIPFDEACIVCLLPDFVHRDAMDRMHSIEGHAIEWRDGYGLNFIHGVSFDDDLFDRFTNGKMSNKEILNHDNQDQKRAMIMNVDMDKLLKEVDAVLLDEQEDDSGNQMFLYKADIGDDEPGYYYKAIDPSKDEPIILRVSPEVKDCREAKIWTWKFLWDKYKNDAKINFIKET